MLPTHVRQSREPRWRAVCRHQCRSGTAQCSTKCGSVDRAQRQAWCCEPSPEREREAQAYSDARVRSRLHTHRRGRDEPQLPTTRQRCVAVEETDCDLRVSRREKSDAHPRGVRAQSHRLAWIAHTKRRACASRQIPVLQHRSLRTRLAAVAGAGDGEAHTRRWSAATARRFSRPAGGTGHDASRASTGQREANERAATHGGSEEARSRLTRTGGCCSSGMSCARAGAEVGNGVRAARVR